MQSTFKIMRFSKSAVACLLLVVLFQICYSIGPVYLSRIIAHSTDRSEIRFGIFVFIGLYFLPYPITYCASLLKVLWKSDARRAFYVNVFSRSFGTVFNIHDTRRQREFNAIVSANGQEIVSESVDFAYNMTSLLASSGASVILISIYVFDGFYVGYLLSAILCTLITWKWSSWQTKSANQAEKAYNRFVSSLPQAWFANTLGETFLMSRFLSMFLKHWKMYRAYALRATQAFQMFSLIQAVCIWTPTTLLVLYQLKNMNVAEIIAFAVVLPRMTETLLDVSWIVSNLGEFLALKGRVQWLQDTIEAEVRQSVEERINFTKLRFWKKVDSSEAKLEVSSTQEFLNALGVSGRFRIEGGNGTGKTSLLIQLKSIFKGGALYIPAKDYLFPSGHLSLSDGQRKLNDLRKIFDILPSEKKLLLFDEWDTNLDSSNIQDISKKLDGMSKRVIVIEVSHKHLGSGPIKTVV